MVMKILYGINVTDKEESVRSDESELIVKRIDSYQQEQLKQAIMIANQQEQRVSLPRWLQYSKLISLIVWVILLFSIINAIIRGASFQEAFSNAPYFFYILPIAFGIWFYLNLLGKSKMREASQDEEIIKNDKFILEVLNQSFEQLEVPKDALQIDVLSFRYRWKEDSLKVVSQGMVSYVNIEKRAYIKDNALHLADAQQVVAVPLEEITEITLQKHRINVPSWNKEIPFNKEPYKQYKMRANQFGMLFIRYYTATIEHDGEQYLLYIPQYDINQLLTLTGLQVTETE
jgi:hypothetical protein